jgi:hypothetical protein
MLPTTYDAVKAVLKADASIPASERTRLLAMIRNGQEAPRLSPAPLSAPRILSRAKAAERLDKSLRFVDRLEQIGLLKKVRLPGRERAIGFRESDIEALIAGGAGTSGVP